MESLENRTIRMSSLQGVQAAGVACELNDLDPSYFKPDFGRIPDIFRRGQEECSLVVQVSA